MGEPKMEEKGANNDPCPDFAPASAASPPPSPTAKARKKKKKKKKKKEYSDMKLWIQRPKGVVEEMWQQPWTTDDKEWYNVRNLSLPPVAE